MHLDREKILVLMAERKMNKGQLVKASNLSYKTLHRILELDGSCSTVTVGKLAEALGVRVEDIL